MAIKVTTKGILFTPDHVFAWEDGKTGDAMEVRCSDFAAADGKGLDYAATMGLKQSTSDAYAGEKDATEAARKRDEKLARITSGTIGTGGGGKRADVVTQEALAIALIETGASAAAFKKAYGSGKAALVAYAEGVADAIIGADADAEPGTYDRAAVTTTVLDELIQDAAAAIDARTERASKIRAKIKPPTK